MLKKRQKWILCIIYSLLLAALFAFFGSLFISRTYGELALAMADSGFLNGLENKRRLFLTEACLPTGCVWGLFLIGSMFILRKKSVRNLRGFVIISVVSALALMVFGGFRLHAGDYVKRQIRLSKVQWYDENRTAIHALGEIDGYTYTNSREALENSFEMGNKVFECDFVLTSDDKLVACHDWNVDFFEGFSEENVPTAEQFMQAKIYGKYTTMSIDDIIEFMRENPDIYVITDTKYAESGYYNLQFNQIVDYAVANNCEEVLKRFIIQIYHPYMYGDLEKIYHFDNYIYTLYQEGYRGDAHELEEYAKFCVLHDIDVITMYAEYYSDELLEICNRYGLQLFVHTVNDDNRQKEFLEKNIGIYTDRYNW